MVALSFTSLLTTIRVTLQRNGWCLLGALCVSLSTLPAHAADYVFPGALPAGCTDKSGGNYSCGTLTLPAGDTVTIAAPMPATITFSGALTAGANVLLNSKGNASDLSLVVNGAVSLGANSVLNGSVQTTGAGAVVVGAGGLIAGNIDTDVGYVTLGASASVGGNVTTITGYVSLAASVGVGGGIRTNDGYVTLGASSSVLSSIETLNSGYVTLGSGSAVSGPIAVSGDGYVLLGDNAVALSSIFTARDSITVGSGAQVSGQVSTQGSALITIVSGGVVFSVCCSSSNSNCVSKESSSTSVTCFSTATTTPVNFECLETGASLNNLVSNPDSRNPLYTKLVGAPFTFDIAALRTSGSLQDKYAVVANRPVTVELVAGDGKTVCASRMPAVAPQAISFSKSDNGRKTVTFKVTTAFADLRCRVTDANQTTAVVGCSSDDFAVRPAAVTLLTTATAVGPSAVATPIIKTGAGFNLSAATAAGDGYAGNLQLYRKKLSSQNPAQDTVVETGGAVGVLTAGKLVANATTPINAAYSEVGYLYLAPGAYRDDNFTAVDSVAGDCITNTTSDQNLATTLASNGQYGCSVGTQTTVSLGRFYPDHFDVVQPVVTAACAVDTPFSYFGQDGFTTTFTLTALTADGITTRNYAGAFARFDLTNYSNYRFTASPLPEGSVLASSATAPIGSAWSLGTARVVAKHQISRPTVPAPQTLITISAAPFDHDLVTVAAIPVGTGTRLRFGRLQMKNSYGSEVLPLPVPLEAQYWVAGGYYVTNTDDSCTVIPAASIVMGNYTKRLAACQTHLSPTGGIALQSGKLPGAGLVLSRPGIDHEGSVDLQLNVTTIASGNTCVDATSSFATAAQIPWFGNNPAARATFGIYKSRLIYSRENY